jgi:small redox-active disulfide protein 2
MKIQVLGSGCPTCQRLYEMTKQAVEEMGLEGQVEYRGGQEGLEKIMAMGLMSSPVLVVDGKPLLTGAVPDLAKIKTLLEENRT